MEQTQPCPPSPSQSLLVEPEGPHRTCSRRKLLFPNRKTASASAQGASEDPDLDPGESPRTSGSPPAPQQEVRASRGRFTFLTATMSVETNSHSVEFAASLQPHLTIFCGSSCVFSTLHQLLVCWINSTFAPTDQFIPNLCRM